MTRNHKQLPCNKHFVAVLALMFANVSMAADYTQDDLNALAADSEWLELLEHVKDIPPSERDEDWRKLVSQASVAALAELGDKDPAGAYELIGVLDKEHKSLSSSPEWLQLRAETGLEAISDCLNDGYYVDSCLDALDLLVAGDPTNASLSFNAASLVRQRINGPHALSLLSSAFNHADGELLSEHCASEDTALITMAGLESSDKAVVGQALQLTFDTCADALAPIAFESFLSGERIVAENTCAAWRERDQLSEFQQAHCDDMEAAR